MHKTQDSPNGFSSPRQVSTGYNTVLGTGLSQPSKTLQAMVVHLGGWTPACDHYTAAIWSFRVNSVDHASRAAAEQCWGRY